MLVGLIVLLVCIASAVYCHRTTKHRSANPILWGTLGAVFDPIVIPFLFMVTKRDPD